PPPPSIFFKHKSASPIHVRLVGSVMFISVSINTGGKQTSEAIPGDAQDDADSHKDEPQEDDGHAATASQDGKARNEIETLVRIDR
ncbi:MAG: hypothetical protein K2F87_02800, partial [Muribaculaceae bacterium]|nr:hypothetical protein [Muribaculaceae bacterium]